LREKSSKTRGFQEGKKSVGGGEQKEVFCVSTANTRRREERRGFV